MARSFSFYQPPNCTKKEFFVIKESCLVQNETKKIKQILDTEYIEINLKLLVMNLNYLKSKHNNLLLDLLPKSNKIFDGTLCKPTDSNYTSLFLFPIYS